jgi:hypothetical protein
MKCPKKLSVRKINEGIRSHFKTGLFKPAIPNLKSDKPKIGKSNHYDKANVTAQAGRQGGTKAGK